MFTVENTDPKCFWLTNYMILGYVKVVSIVHLVVGVC